MRSLADESCDHQVVRALRADGHDVRVSTDFSSAGADDDVVIAAARDEDRILLTEDRDFGQLVYAQVAGRHRASPAGTPPRQRTAIVGCPRAPAGA